MVESGRESRSLCPADVFEKGVTNSIMIPVKIQCGCGQRYAFDVEPVNGCMPGAVACPVCGADGTSAADSVIAQSLAAQAAVAAAPVGVARLRPATAVASMALPSPASPALRPAASRVGVKLPGQVDRTQAEHEARAKISWGDAPAAVISYLRMQGFSQEEASRLVGTMFQERAAMIRANGIHKSFVGIGLICVPIVALLVFLSMGYIPLKLFAVTLMIGTYGAWLLLKGVIMFLAPKSEPGDVAEQ
jgi:hypothetical protein